MRNVSKRTRTSHETKKEKAERESRFNQFINDQKKGLIPGRFNPKNKIKEKE